MLTVALLDDDAGEMGQLSAEIGARVPNAEVRCFSDPDSLERSVRRDPPTVTLLDYRLGPGSPTGNDVSASIADVPTWRFIVSKDPTASHPSVRKGTSLRSFSKRDADGGTAGSSREFKLLLDALASEFGGTGDLFLPETKTLAFECVHVYATEAQLSDLCHDGDPFHLFAMEAARRAPRPDRPGCPVLVHRGRAAYLTQSQTEHFPTLAVRLRAAIRHRPESHRHRDLWLRVPDDLGDGAPGPWASAANVMPRVCDALCLHWGRSRDEIKLLLPSLRRLKSHSDQLQSLPVPSDFGSSVKERLLSVACFHFSPKVQERELRWLKVLQESRDG